MADLTSHTVTVDTTSLVRGRDHYKYFRRPLGSEGNTLSDIKYEPEPIRIPTPPPKTPPKTRTVGTQSIYRESETQTVPYSPDYIVRDESKGEPEILHLKRLGLGHDTGLPAGKEEVEMIERARQRRAFEASLPPLTGGDPAAFAQRQRMLEEQEELEQSYKIEFIRKEQQEKLQQVEAAIKSREAEKDKNLTNRVEGLVARRIVDKDDLVTKLQADQIKELRKLADLHKNVEQKKEKRNIIEDYSNFASKIYATPAREGMTKTGLGKTIAMTTSPVLNNFSVLDEFDAQVTQTLSPSRQELTLRRKTKLRRQEVLLQTQLANVDAAIARTKNTKPPTPLPPPAVAQRIERPPPRPPTPTVNTDQPQQSAQLQQLQGSKPATASRILRGTLKSSALAGMDEAEQQEAQTRAIILLQRLIRGRAMQSINNMKRKRKERRRELIQELRTETPSDLVENDKKFHQQEKIHEELEKRRSALAGAIVGMEVGTALDFLAKELVRKRQLAEITRLVQIAEKTRMRRESEEGGTRQRQELARLKSDWEYTQIGKAHAVTVETYLDEIRAAAVRFTAKVHAREALAGIQAQKEKEREERKSRMQAELGDDFDPEEWDIQEFVASFLLPAVDKKISLQSVDVQERECGLAVQGCLHSVLLQLENV